LAFEMTTVSRIVFTESGGFAGLRRRCTIEPQALPEAPGKQFQSLLAHPPLAAAAESFSNMPDMLLYTLELVTEPPDVPDDQPDAARVGGASTALKLPAPDPDKELPPTGNWVLRYPATDVPAEIEDLVEYLHEQAQPLELE
jgi:hypothetical protein